MKKIIMQFVFPNRNSMYSFRPGRGHDSRKSVFYTSEEWELLDPSPRDLEESSAQEDRRKQTPEGNKGAASASCPLAAVGSHRGRQSRPFQWREAQWVRVLCVGDQRPEKPDVTRHKYPPSS